MKTTLAVWFAALVAIAAAAPAASAEDGGWVVVSMTKDLHYTTMQLVIDPMEGDKGGRIMGTGGLGFGDTYHKFGETSGGYIYAAKFRPGMYHITNFRLKFPATGTNYASKQKFSLPFEVKANEIAYIGEFLATGTIVKPVFIAPNVETPYFITSNQEARDLPIAVAENPQLKDLPVRFALIKTSAGTFMRKARVAEK